MTRRPVRAAALAVMTSLALVHGAFAQTVHRCVGTDGASVYSDKPCASQGLASKQVAPAHDVASFGRTAELSLEMDSGPVAASEGCPGPDAESLREALETAVNSSDLNALTGMYHWASAGRSSASHVISRMQSLIERRPVEVQVVAAVPNDDWLWAGLPPPSEPDAPSLEVRSTAERGGAAANFQLRTQAGCLWIAGY